MKEKRSWWLLNSEYMLICGRGILRSKGLVRQKQDHVMREYENRV